VALDFGAKDREVLDAAEHLLHRAKPQEQNVPGARAAGSRRISADR
jgi:hypothetical protein